MIMPILKTLLQSYGRPAAVGWLVTGFCPRAGTAAVSGRLGDLYGRKPVMLVMFGPHRDRIGDSAPRRDSGGHHFRAHPAGFRSRPGALTFVSPVNTPLRAGPLAIRGHHGDDIS